MHQLLELGYHKKALVKNNGWFEVTSKRQVNGCQ
jgi:hypothetical protein